MHSIKINKMKKIFGAFLLLNFSISFSQNQFDNIVNHLSKSYINQDLTKECLIETEGYSIEQIEKDSKLYNSAVEAFMNSEIEIIKYLLKYEYDYSPSTYVETPNPCSSNYIKSRNKAQDALILINSYLRGYDSIMLDSNSNKLTYNFIKSFYNEIKGLKRVDAQKKYRKKLLNIH